MPAGPQREGEMPDSDQTTTTDDAPAGSPRNPHPPSEQEQEPDEASDDAKRATDGLRADLARERKARQAAEKRHSTLEAELGRFQQANQSEQEKATAKAVAEAEKAARDDERGKANRRIIAAEVKAAAGGRLQDPADATRYVDLEEFQVDDDGDIDQKAVVAAIDQLLKDKPYLAANNGKAGGSADQGTRRKDTAAQVEPGIGRLRAAYAESSKK